MILRRKKKTLIFFNFCACLQIQYIYISPLRKSSIENGKSRIQTDFPGVIPIIKTNRVISGNANMWLNKPVIWICAQFSLIKSDLFPDWMWWVTHAVFAAVHSGYTSVLRLSVVADVLWFLQMKPSLPLLCCHIVFREKTFPCSQTSHDLWPLTCSLGPEDLFCYLRLKNVPE